MIIPTWNAVLLSFLITGIASAEAGAPTARRVAFSCGDARSCTISGSVIVDGQELPLRSNAADIPADAATVELRADGYWMPPQAPAPEMLVWRTAPLRGRFKLQPRADDALPTSFKINFSSPPMAAQPRVPADSTVECRVGADGSWTCALPATTLDLALRAKGFIPHYLWDVKVPTALTEAVPLKRGASFVAWIDRRVAAAMEKPATARVLRAAMSDASALGMRLGEAVAEAAFNRRGMVQLAPIPPGLYTIEVTAPGFATTRLENIEIHERSESSLRQVIELKSPVTIELTLLPPTDPTGAPWKIDLFHREPISGRSSRVRGGAYREPGIFEVKGQAPGRYNVSVEDVRGDTYASAELVIATDADARRTIQLTLANIRGIVTIGGEPVASARLRFGGNGGPEQIKAIADAEGRFDVTLPRTGKWAVEVESERDGVNAVSEITIAKDQESVEIELPDTEVAGWVIDADGVRMRDAQVTLRTTAGPVMKFTKADGTFRFRGVAPGTANIHATHKQEFSRGRTVSVVPEQHVANLELALLSASDLAGIVISNGQPVVGARVLGYGYVDGFARQEKTVTALDGSFRLQFPDAAREVVLLVAAAGRTMQGYSIVGRPRSTTLDLAAAGGTLRLEWEKGETRPDLRIFYNGVLLPLNDVLLWARSHGQNIVDRAIDIPHLAPGSYRFCNGSRCADGVLAARGSLTLRATR